MHFTEPLKQVSLLKNNTLKYIKTIENKKNLPSP